MMRSILLFIPIFPIILLAKSDVRLIMYADALMHVSQNTVVDARDNEIYRVLQVEYVSPDSVTGKVMIDTMLVFAEIFDTQFQEAFLLGWIPLLWKDITQEMQPDMRARVVGILHLQTIWVHLVDGLN